jgi:hypothetical protein
MSWTREWVQLTRSQSRCPCERASFRGVTLWSTRLQKRSVDGGSGDPEDAYASISTFGSVQVGSNRHRLLQDLPRSFLVHQRWIASRSGPGPRPRRGMQSRGNHVGPRSSDRPRPIRRRNAGGSGQSARPNVSPRGNQRSEDSSLKHVPSDWKSDSIDRAIRAT